jgi:hypothetical protein
MQFPNLKKIVVMCKKIYLDLPSSQMPRGNLEHIEPRALVLYYVRKLIDEYPFESQIINGHTTTTTKF